MDSRLEQMKMTEILSAVTELVLPRVCIVCERQLLPQEKHICTCCLADLPLTGFWKMARNPMADRLNAMIENGDIKDGERYAYACALFYYSPESPYDRISQRLKYWREFDAGKLFSGMLGEQISKADYLQDLDVVIPVPLHWTRHIKRGYNQAEIIARKISEVLGIPCRTKLLKRTHRTKTQTEIKGGEKASNVKNAFKASQTKKKYHHILLVDDIFTSGSTTSSCLRALREVHGTETRISVATLGFVED